MQTKKILLPESELPKQWYNIQADMPDPMEPLFTLARVTL